MAFRNRLAPPRLRPSDRLVLAGKLSDLKDLAEPQLTEAQKQLKALDATLEAARKQIDELRGINTSAERGRCHQRVGASH